MEVYNSPYLHLTFFAESELIEATWQYLTEGMQIEDFKHEFLSYRRIVLQYQPKKIIVDHRDLLFPIIPEVQKWINENIFKDILDAGLCKAAIIMGTDLVNQLATEQMMEEEEGSKFTTRYFDNKEEATIWVLS